MAKYPEGNFTIVNNETGRAVRVRLGDTHNVSDHKEGTAYLQYVTEKPTLRLSEADNTPATVWWHSTIKDSQQIVSYAVGEYQNIGDYCVWMYAQTNSSDRFNTQKAFKDRLNDMPADVRSRLAPLIPAEWTTVRDRFRARRAKRMQFEERGKALADAELEAWNGQDDPPSAGDLATLRTYRFAVADGSSPDWLELQAVMYEVGTDQVEKLLVLPEAQVELLSEGARHALHMLFSIMKKVPSIDWKTVERLENDPRAAKVAARAAELLPGFEERRAAAALAAIASDDLREWHSQCAFRKTFGEDAGFHFTDGEFDTPEDKRIVAALDAYLKAAAKERVIPPVIASNAATELDGCGASRGQESTYGWTYDGTYIYSSDSKTVSYERTYWTDENGYLVGKPKGGPGQTWSIKKWTPTKSGGPSRSDIALTGLFGPIGRALGL
ncbi:hypothetical protein ACFWRV_01885 [Streptomyces sp. NPDC058576]|uniref:hypothetical protein n=1 Tax=Streptomyces sp. NPDC058576 TaxID=3346547 RepID=UPI0036580890